MKIIDILKTKQTYSFEFFPPKQPEHEAVLFKTINRLAKFNPDFVSITYGAGGSTSAKTFQWTKQIENEHRLNTMMHFTCYGNNADTVLETCKQMRLEGITNILALRGDHPAGIDNPVIEFKYASELITFIKTNYPDMCIGVAGYPEKHGQADSMQTDIDNLKRKIDAGGDFIVTQLFFDNKHVYDYMDLLSKNNINAPVIAGIMPVSNISQVKRFEDMCSITVPAKVVSKLEKLDNASSIEFGMEYAFTQAADLIKNGIAGVHFYTLNKHQVTEKIMSALLKI